MTNISVSQEKFSLLRYVEAQAKIYDSALAELKRGKKVGHWMWFIFPQIRGLGTTSTSRFFGIQNDKEAKEYLADSLLGKRLIECTTVLINITDLTAREIFGYPDELKLQSSMTLFEKVSSNKNVFTKVIDKYYQGKRDEKTFALLNQNEGYKS